MKIAIVGAGFYGCYFAKHLSKKHKVYVFEKNSRLIMEAGYNNQYRLHQGFHYPRSQKTIQQTKEGYIKFIKEFKKYIYFPKHNYYCIHKNSKIGFLNYLKVLKKNKLNFEIVNKDKIPFLRKELIEGAINTREGVILIDKLTKQLIKDVKKKCLVKINSKVTKINNKKGIIQTQKKNFYFDKIINTTYTDPNLGLENNKFNLKYELASLIIPRLKIKNVPGITIMDGNFVSLYPRNKYNFSLSSVKYTPVKKLKSLKHKDLYLSQIFKNKNLIKKNILNNVSKFIDLKKINYKYSKIEIAPKTKIKNDKGDIRTTELIAENKVISILCGKLDAVPLIYKKILKLI
tara:strand:- start:542 stop:1579 length:1038 start_codon:yes stop_codon:yes gene_type:complete